ncbi:glyceraldehyde-3-phosphate dehydrogenase A, chloroplastic isoform X1 [Capsicum annuum]|uniref:glyceraldehyde-3-phosphate dehydrogenase A, chloroplastic isoform X1 n=1 Tax=Capsicum annuum TaxID=4072 RepID=UPI001FB0D278|nr:glyceraldehyde-3-phosphate dehydrogenase A, chloroplastic isoform X1 [Capsicum annuum]
MASAALSVANSSLHVTNKRSFSEFTGLRTSFALPFGKKANDDLLSFVAFHNSVVSYSILTTYSSTLPYFSSVLIACSYLSSLRGQLLVQLIFQMYVCNYMFVPNIKHSTLVAEIGGGKNKGRVVEAKLKVAINGFGRIGRNFLRCWHGRKDSPLEVIAINDSGGVKQASHLLKYDSTLGIFDADVKPVGTDGISVDGKVIKVVSDRNPINLPWKDLGVDLVIEGTGVFVDREGAGKHIQAGAKKVLITAPGKGDIPTYVVGVNADLYSPDEPIISNASCTTNCLAPFVKVLDQKFGIIKGTMTTTHSYTGDQRLLDASHRDLRRARAAALNIVPTSTGAAKAVALVLPSLKGKLNGIALRVPTPNVSVVDLVVQVSKKTFAEEVNAAFRESADKELAGILSVCDEPLVSVDFRCSDVSSTVDASLTMVMGDDMVKVIAWYDNEWGYSQRVVDLADIVANQWK